jgi:hypothetical protein
VKFALKLVSTAVTVLLLLVLTLWGILAFRHCSWPFPVRVACIVLYLGASGVVLFVVKSWRRKRNALFGLFGLVLVAWCLMFPSNARDWQTPVARLAYAEVDGDQVTFRNVRNFDYSSEKEFVARYYDRTYNLSELESVDVYLVNWGIPQVSHAMVSFGFGNDVYICFSFETRKEKGETYSTLKGFFRTYELYCVVADERDVVRLRTNYRMGEDVYLYRMIPEDIENVRRFFLEYVQIVNDLKERADWYNALTDNCMTSAFKLGRMNAAAGRAKWHWKILLNGYADELAYERGSIDTSLPFPELKRISRVNDRAVAADSSPDFSRLIRAGVPGM